ncbi:GAF domain-containing protein [Plectonema cf. radiosum LEGE 06105]|uniref:histidine kinase n=1 Tax=Plectonema cf. radiosum LEGE 06105 TaxID=945769 RepID=A0A8J7JVE2_9CYAN|nr:GAF domain-containing sensor histidine kinase [Plectonema radiosum]MBE9215699.1 GAF domain-containing protein [Plectonema cf. radiosum LEGE 06105]
MLLESQNSQQKQRTLEVLSSLSYRNGELKEFLQEITIAVSKLITIDWSVITLCQKDFDKILASSIELDDYETIYSLHDVVTGTVVETGKSLTVEDTNTSRQYGKVPEGYRSYLGVPLRTSQGQVIGTICSFHQQPRKYNLEEVTIVELFAERAATAIDNYQLYQQQCKFNQILEAEVARRTEELKAAQAKLLETERLAAIGEFASRIIHEIRNPFTTMKMGLNYFNKIDKSEASQIRLSLALEEADRLERLLKEILLYAKPQHLQRQTIDINEFLTETLESLRMMPFSNQRQIDFELKNYPPSTQLKVMGDKDKLKQIMINLVRNACEAISVGETVKIQLENNLKEQVLINICNGGEPIPPEILPKLTQLFYSTKSSGTGLGLAIVKRIVESHNGELLIKSSSEEGTTISVKLPICS